MALTTLHMTTVWHSASAGVRTFYTALLAAGNRERRRVIVVVPGARDAVEPVGRYGAIHHVAAPSAVGFDRGTIDPHAYLPIVGRRLVSILERHRPDVVEICDQYALPYFAAMLRREWFRRVRRPALVGLICERFDDGVAASLGGGAAARRFTQWYIRHVYGPQFDVHVASSEHTAEELRTALPDRAPGFIRVCAMGVDADGFAPERRSAATRARLIRQAGGRADSTLLFYRGMLSPGKNLGLLVDALRRLAADQRADYRLVVAGDGPLADWLRAQASGILFGRIVLCANPEPGALADSYANADVFVHPSLREPFGIGPLEAMASGVPVVAAAGGALPHASHDNAWIVAPRADALAAAIRTAVHNDGRRIAAALAAARAFCWEDATSRYFDLYDRVHASLVRASRSKNTHFGSGLPEPVPS